MPGTANTTEFMLGTATVMLGPAASLYDLTPASHSIGLVKNFSMSAEPSYTDLQQGVKGSLVYSVLTSNPVRASMEVYEFTAKNLNYGLGLDGSSVVAQTVSTVLDAASAGSGADLVLPTGEGTNYSADDYIMIEVDTDDHILIRKVVSIATDTLTLDQDINEVIPIGATVKVVNQIAVGAKGEQPFLAAKVIGRLANGQPLGLLIPKVRITRGFTAAFSTDQYGNMPFELSVYDPVTTDTFYSEFSDSDGPVGARAFKVS